MAKLRGRPPEEVKPGHCKGQLYGKAGAGKTWFALNFPTPYYIDTEGGSRLGHYQAKLKESGGAYFGPQDGANDFDTVIEEIKTLATDKHQFKTLVIDSITKVFQSAIATEAERLKSASKKDEFGASKKPAVSSMRRLLNWISKLDMNCWFIAHEIAEWQNIGGERKETGRIADAWDKLKYELDLELRVEHPGPAMRVAIVTKSRLKGFPEFDRIQLQEGNQDRGYAEFAARYGKDYIEAEVKPIVLATTDQVAEISRLLEIIKIDESEVDKILSKANAEKYEELSEDQATGMIKWLNKKLSKESK